MKRIYFGLLFFVLSISTSNGQNMPFSLRNNWDGLYDIKMIAAPNLDPVFIRSNLATSGSLLADSLIRYETIARTGDLLQINNVYKGGSPFIQISIPRSAFICGDPNAPGCLLGLQTTTPNTSCPTPRYNGPALVNQYISMSYADYDNDLTTFSSSMAQLDIPGGAQIESAYIYWTGNWQGSNPNIILMDGPVNSFNGVNASSVFNTTTTSGYNTIKFKIPGGAYQDVTSDSNYIGTATYMCVANVTNLVQSTGGGQFWASNIQSYPIEGGGGSTSGWVLAVVFSSSSLRSIALWDGFTSITSNSSLALTLTGIQAPPTANAASYMGLAVLDGENLAVELIGLGSSQEGLGFQTNNGGSYIEVNPFATDQPPYKLYNRKGYPAMCDYSDNIDLCKKPLYDGSWCASYDGISSSHITTYNEITGKNGNEITRLPDGKNTLGFDAHHMKLPEGSVAPGATQATLTIKAGAQGTTLPFLAYLAVEKSSLSTGINNKYSQSANIYPNPSSGLITIETPVQSDNAKIRIFSVVGILQKEVMLNNSIKQEVNLEGLNSGMYIYEIWQDGERRMGGKLQMK